MGLGVTRDAVGINPAVQIVIDALKLSPANPSFLDMRDAILQAALDLRTAGRITTRQHFEIRRQVTKAFSKFHMGPRAASNGTQLTVEPFGAKRTACAA